MEGSRKAYDKYFKEIFGNVAIAGEFMAKHLPKSIVQLIEIKSLEVQKDSFIDKELEKVFSDLLFMAKVNRQEGIFTFCLSINATRIKTLHCKC